MEAGKQAAVAENGALNAKAAAARGAADAATMVEAPGAAKGGAAGSIFDIYSRRRKAAMLFVCALGTFLVPVSDTIYLPALAAVEADLNTTSDLVATSVAVYMYMVGLGALFFGPAADRFGRRGTLTASTAVFTALCLVTIWAPNIEMLLAMRAVQGFVVASCATTSNAILADIFAPQERGRAMGIAAVPFLVGPVIGPLLGGGLSQSLGWRSTFAALTIVGGAITIAQLLVLQARRHMGRRTQGTLGDVHCTVNAQGIAN
ncbi:MAG: major facilitator superfamily domain-containing protein [Monoraphidium minutum]|nr:MAG: major facilitator superfamily domain-containing protein [Monoraphidium minutum]